MSFQILPERRDDAALIEPLLDRTFGLDRQQRTVYRLRAGIAPLPGLSFVAVDDRGLLLASIRYWPILIAGHAAILLGPLAVEPHLQGQGIGKSLVRFSLEEARRLGHRLCVVVGEPGYYRPFGFVNAGEAGLILPGPVAPERFQVAALAPGALEGVQGLIGRDPGTAAPLLAGNQ
jgi:predicted N-acetyltransferase YhbS